MEELTKEFNVRGFKIPFPLRERYISIGQEGINDI